MRQNQERFLSEIGPGWHALFNRVFQLAAAHPACYIATVRDYFGELLIDAVGGNETIKAAILEARQASKTTCQYCGAKSEKSFCNLHRDNGQALLRSFRTNAANMVPVASA